MMIGSMKKIVILVMVSRFVVTGVVWQRGTSVVWQGGNRRCVRAPTT